jgi:hypothetical protein
MKKITKIILILCSLLCFACQKNDVVENQELISESDINTIQKNTDDSLPLWIPGNYSKLVVVFGHGYETEELQAPVIAELEKNFGLAENKGLIILRTFPENYFNGKKVSSDWLRKSLEKDDVFAIIIIGSPEKTHYTLADLQDNGFSGKVYSIFPQDDILGTESGSEFVLSYKSLGAKLDESPVYVIDTTKDISKLAKSYEEEGMFSGDISKVLIPIIKRLKSVNKKAIPGTPKSFVSYLNEGYKEFFADFEISSYVDAQTGIKSLNHYVFGVYDE